MAEQDEQNDIRLPHLNPLVTLSKAPGKGDGTPVWTLHNPVSNEYFQLSWAEFECLARFADHRTASALVEAVKREHQQSLDDRGEM